MADSGGQDYDGHDAVQVIRWPHAKPLPEEEVIRFFQARKLSFSRWSNRPNETYSLHAHAYRKMLFCMMGGITFMLPDRDESIQLSPGDRLTLQPGVRHSAVVGPDGVTCIEAGE
jgi:quercetin dioxygenase-like cupin family protein